MEAPFFRLLQNALHSYMGLARCDHKKINITGYEGKEYMELLLEILMGGWQRRLMREFHLVL